MFDSASEFAREVGVNRRTVINWIKQGKIKTFKRKGKLYKIPEKEGKKIKHLKKSYRKCQMPWNIIEENLIRYSPHLKDKEIAELIARTPEAVRVHKTIMRKKGLIR